MTASTLPLSPPALFALAHPGHELRAHHLVERLGPRVAVLTDGSGSTGHSRLDQTTELLASLGATPARPYGALSDREAYDALMSGRVEPFAAAMSDLAGDLAAFDIRTIVIDAAEGFNPVHDVCHWIARGAIAIAETRRAAHRFDPYELDLVAHPEGDGAGVRVRLEDAAFDRKIASARRYEALAAEAAAAYELHGLDAFRTEFVRRLGAALPPDADWKPGYEQVGEARVAAGRYTSVLRYRDHVRPVVLGLCEIAGLPTCLSPSS